MTAYSAELFFYFFGFDITSEREAHKSSDSLGLACCAPSGLSHLGEELEKVTVFVFVGMRSCLVWGKSMSSVSPLRDYSRSCRFAHRQQSRLPDHTGHDKPSADPAPGIARVLHNRTEYRYGGCHALDLALSLVQGFRAFAEAPAADFSRPVIDMSGPRQ